MKPLEQIFTPDIASLDVRIGPLYFGSQEKEYENVALVNLHRDLSLLTCVEKVPEHIQQNIELSKNLLLYSIYVFSFATASVHYAQIALESSLRSALGKSENCRDNIDTMLKEAISRKMLTADNHNYIVFPGFVSISRNGISHGKEGRNVFNQAIAIPFVKMILETINVLFSQSPLPVRENHDEPTQVK